MGYVYLRARVHHELKKEQIGREPLGQVVERILKENKKKIV